MGPHKPTRQSRATAGSRRPGGGAPPPRGVKASAEGNTRRDLCSEWQLPNSADCGQPRPGRRRLQSTKGPLAPAHKPGAPARPGSESAWRNQGHAASPSPREPGPELLPHPRQGVGGAANRTDLEGGPYVSTSSPPVCNAPPSKFSSFQPRFFPEGTGGIDGEAWFTLCRQALPGSVVGVVQSPAHLVKSALAQRVGCSRGTGHRPRRR